MTIVTRTPKEAVEHWIKALRSGEYTQGFYQLRQIDGNAADGDVTFSFCCLGVLCDLAAKEGGSQWCDTEFMHHEHSLPKIVGESVGISRSMEIKLMNMNDNRLSFDQIAIVIEEELLPSLE